MENHDFDEDLKNHIKKKFEDYDDGQADAGWDLLREKYPEKNKRRYFFWWLAAALLLTILVFWFFQPERVEMNVAKNAITIRSNLAQNQTEPDISSKKTISKKDSSNMQLREKQLLKTASGFAYNQKFMLHKTSINHSKNAVIIQSNPSNDTVFTGVKLDSAAHANDQTQTLNLAKADSATQKNTQLLIDFSKNQTTKSNLKKEVVKTASVQKAAKKISRFGWSLYAGPQLNFARNSSTQLGFGAGISADFTLSKRLKLETGLGLAHNKLSYQSNSNNNLYALNPAYQSLANAQITAANITALNGLNASLLQLDVPINLVYQFLPGKNSIAVLAGLSSGTFVKESYQYNYVNAANNSRSSKSFQSFYLLKTLNLAAQIGLPIKKYHLQVEPFVKVPLGNLASQQLKFGAAGINLKFNFQQ